MPDAAYFTEAGETDQGGTTVIAPSTPTLESGAVAPTSEAVVATPNRDPSGRFVSTKEENVELGEVAEPQATATQATPTDTEARKTGWKPLEEYAGDPRKWVPADAWVANQPLVNQIKAYKQQLREKNRAIETAQQYYARMHESAYQTAMKDLLAQKDQAIVEQDRDKVYEIERYMAQAQSERAKAPAAAPVVDPAYLEWRDSNPTIVGDPDMVKFAVAYEQALMASEPDIDKRLEDTTQAVRLKFPDRFKNVRRSQPTLVEGASSGASPASSAPAKFGESNLSPLERQEMNRMVAQGILTKADYLRDIQAYDKKSFAI